MNLTKKELEKIYCLNLEIKELREELKILRQKAVPGAGNLTGLPKNNSISDKTGKLAIKIAETEEMLHDSINRLLEARKELERFLQEMDDPELRLIIRYRAVFHLGWQEIGDEMGMDRRTAARKYQEFEKKYLAHNAL